MTALACLSLLAPASLPAQAQGNWTVTDQLGNPLISSADGYDLKGSPTGSIALGGAYPDVLAAAQNPNASTNSDAFTPNLSSYQGWLFSGNAPGPYQVYDPFHIWTEAAASNTVGYRGSSGRAFRLGPPSNKDVNGSITAATGGTLWAIWQWSNPYASSPDHITVLLTSRVSASATVGTYGSPPSSSGLSAAATASDSLGETVTATAGSPPPPTVTGKRLLRVPVNANGRAVVSLGGTTTATATNTVPYGTIGNYPGTSYGGYPMVTNGSTGANASAYISGTAAQDYREVTISSSLEPTYRKNPTTGLPVLNVRNWSGFMTADTVAPDTALHRQVTYSPNYDPSQWGSGSHYVWHSNTYPPDYSGTFNQYFQGVPAPYVDYTNPPTTPGANDYITLTLTDSTDGISISNSYSVLFHDYYENWIRDATQTKQHPGAFIKPDGTLNPDWIRLTVNDNNSPTSPSVHLSQDHSESITQSGTIGTQGSLSAPGVAALQRNESITNGKTVTGTVSTTLDLPGYPWSKIVYYVAKTYEERGGTTDAYAANGFQGIQSWTGIFANDPMVLSLHTELEQSYPPH